MGLAELLLGKDNPFTQWVGGNQNLLNTIGAGLGQGQNIQSGLSAGLAALPEAKALDRADAEKAKADAKLAAQTNATQAWLAKNAPDLADMVNAGMPVSEAWRTALERMQPQTGASPTANMQDFLFGQQNPGYWEALHPGAQPDKPNVPAGYRTSADGNLEFIPGGPADPSTAGKTTEATRRNQQLAKVIIPEMQTLEQNWSALSDVGNQAWGSTGATSGLTSPAYQQAKNSLRTIIASYLYSVSGATANPGEVENQAAILTPQFGESADSVNKKLDRVKTMVQAVVEAAQGAPFTPSGSGGDIDSLVNKYLGQ